MSPSMPSTGGSAGGTNSVGSSTDEMHSNGTAGGSGGGGAGGGIGTSKAPGQTQPVMTPGKIMPEGPASSPGKSGPLLFERAGGNAEVPAQGLKGRVLRGGGGPGTDGGVNVSKVCAVLEKLRGATCVYFPGGFRTSPWCVDTTCDVDPTASSRGIDLFMVGPRCFIVTPINIICKVYSMV